MKTKILCVTVYLPEGKQLAGGDAPTLGLMESDLKGLSFEEAEKRLLTKTGCGAFLPDRVVALLPVCYVACELLDEAHVEKITADAKRLTEALTGKELVLPNWVVRATAQMLAHSRPASRAELDQAMAFRYFAMGLQFIADGGVSAFGNRAPLTPAQVEVVFEQLKRHPDYRLSVTITLQTIDGTWITLLDGKVSRKIPNLSGPIRSDEVAGARISLHSQGELLSDAAAKACLDDLRRRAAASAHPPVADWRPKKLWCIHLHDTGRCVDVIIPAVDDEAAKKLAREWTFEDNVPVLNRSIIEQAKVQILTCRDVTSDKSMPKIVHA